MKLNNKSIKIILILLIFISLSLGIAYASGAFLGGSNEVSLTKGLVGHWKLDEETYDEYTENIFETLNFGTNGQGGLTYQYVGIDEDGWIKYSISGTGTSDTYPYTFNIKPVNIHSDYPTSFSFKYKTNVPQKYLSFGDPRMVNILYKPGLIKTDIDKGDYREAKLENVSPLSTTGGVSIVGFSSQPIYFLSRPIQGQVFNPATDFLYFKDVQVEIKPYSTSYANGTRQSKVVDSTPYENHGTSNLGSNISPFTTDRFGNEKGALNFGTRSDNHYINLGNSDNLKITGSQTISMWLKPSNIAAGRQNPYEKAYGGEGTITQETSGSLSYYYGTGGGDASPYQGFGLTNNLVNNEWAHVVIVRDLDSMKLKWYKNGILSNEGSANYAQASVSSKNVRIGTGYAGPYSGSIDDVRIYNRALSAEEIKLLYDSYRPQTTVASLNRGLVLDMLLTSTWTKSETLGSEVITDKTPYSNDGQNYGATLTNEGASFDGVNDYIRTGYLPQSSTYSISIWFKSLDDVSGKRIYWGTNSDRAILALASNYKLQFYARPDSSPASGYITSALSYKSGEWNNAILVYTGSRVKLFINGEEDPNNGIVTGTVLEYRLNLATSYNAGSSFFNGSLSNLKIYNRALSEEEVKLLYDQGRNNFGSILSHPKSCKEILDLGLSKGDGIYTIRPDLNQEPFEVYCDMTTDGGGWTLISVVRNDGGSAQIIVGNNFCTSLDTTIQCKGKMPINAISENTKILVKDLSSNNWLIYSDWNINSNSALRYFTLEKSLTSSSTCDSPHVCGSSSLDPNLRIYKTSGFTYNYNNPMYQWWRYGGWWIGTDPSSGGNGRVHATSYSTTQNLMYRNDKDAYSTVLSSGHQAIFWQ